MFTGLNFDSLSEREREIVEHAIDGLTDQQIANKLEITASTVNSYWVRIRGKLGHLSRTELVSRVIQQRLSSQSKQLAERIRELESELRSTKREKDQVDLLEVAFRSNPNPVVLFKVDGQILLQNDAFNGLFRVLARDPNYGHIQDFFDFRKRNVFEVLESEPMPHKVGLGFPIFGVTALYESFRVYLIVNKASLNGESVYVCVVRPFAEEYDLAHSRAEVVMTDLRGQKLFR